MLFFINKQIFIEKTEVIDGGQIAARLHVDGVEFSAIISFNYRSMNGNISTNTVEINISITALLVGAGVDSLHRAAGLLIQNKQYISDVLGGAWENNFFPYPA